MEDTVAYQHMFNWLNDNFELSAQAWSDYLPELSVIRVEGNHTLQEAGLPVSKFYFLVDGLVRFYYITPDGKELNKAFYGANNIVGSLSALIMNEPCRFGVATLEPSILIEMPYESKSNVWRDSPDWQEVFNRCCQLMLIRNERREHELLTFSAKERFLQLIRNFPDYSTRIPQYHIASYLGITPVALSKYKKDWLK